VGYCLARLLLLSFLAGQLLPQQLQHPIKLFNFLVTSFYEDVFDVPPAGEFSAAGDAAKEGFIALSVVVVPQGAIS
jgi:hypothetical protein